MNTPSILRLKPTRIASGPHAFFVVLASLAFALFAMHRAHAAPPPAGTSIGNQASATYTDASGIGRLVTSNVVQTIVQQVASLTLATNGAQTSTPGTTVYYPHTLTNTGNGGDTFGLAAVNGSGFTMTGVQIFADNGSGQPTGPAIASSGPLAAGAVFKFIVVGVVPATATSGQNNALTVTSTSGFSNTTTASNTDTTTVTNNAVITVTKSVSASSGAPGSGPYAYTLTYTNTGNSTATAVTVSDPLAVGLTYVAGSGRWSVTGATALSDSGGSAGTAPNTITSTYTSGSTTLQYVLSQVTAGQSGTVTFQVNVGSGLAPGVRNNTAADSYNDGSGTTVTGNSNTVPFTVTETAAVTLTGATVANANPGATVSFANVVTNTGNGTDTFNITFGSNTFPAGTAFSLYKSDGVTPLTDTNGDGKPDTGPLAAGASYTVTVKAQLPANASGGPFTVNKTATSVFDPTKFANTTDTLTAITRSAIDLTDNSAYNTTTPAPGQGAGPEASPVVTNAVNPGASTTFTVYVNNIGPVADAYDLAASTVSNFSSVTLPAGWTVAFKADGGTGNCSTTGATISTTGSIAAGGNAVVCAQVSVPASGAGAVAGASQIYLRGLSAASGALDTIHEAVSVNAVRSIIFTPNNTNQTYPGGTVVYSHTLTNTGNVLEGNGALSTVILAAVNNKASWTSVLYYDLNGNGVLDAGDSVVPAGGLQAIPALAGGLAPGQSITIFDKVTAPSGAQVGDVNTSTVTVSTANGSYTTTAPTPAVATDGTTVIAGNLQLTKAQALDAGCSGPVGGTVYSASNVNALPGQCVLYQITVRNVGSANATTVVVSDATPAYTTLNSTAATTVGTVSGPASGAAGSISATIGTLAPGQSAFVTFGVKVQQ
ncbi:MAG TPA: hypothetical protein VMV25_09465 [Steroidobacteraceae bacterium]|nr:hypothetical protein [Steroidobacteraceae bacterium]